MKVKDLRKLLEEKLEVLEGFEDEQEIKTVSNTYFLGGAPIFLGIAGYDGGYVNLAYLEEQIIDDNEYDEYDEEDD